VPESAYDPEADERLGRAFDRRLAARLADAARPHRVLIAGSMLLFPVIAVAELAQPWLLKIAIDDHILKSDWLGLTWVAGLYVTVLVVLYALRTVEAYLMQLTGQRVIHDLRETIFDHLLRLEARFYDRNPVGRLMTRVLHDVEAVSEAFTSGLFAVVADVITLVGVVAVMLWIDWRLALVTFSIIPVLLLVAVYFRLNARDAYREVRRRLARLNAFFQESLQGMRVIQLFVRERYERERFGRLNADYRRALFGSTVWEASLYAAVEALGSIALRAQSVLGCPQRRHVDDDALRQPVSTDGQRRFSLPDVTNVTAASDHPVLALERLAGVRIHDADTHGGPTGDIGVAES
jgi:ATP-binding cassette subfamily B protein